ncbi:MAG: hypothetical protein QG549_853 [Patescibacteria group bacterium]|nr:hypothetical protein [Patescibacteria group bacterium]
MAHEQLNAPRSSIDQDFKDLDDFPEEERFLFVADLFRRIKTDGRLEGAIKHSSELSSRTHTGAIEYTKYDSETLPVDSLMRAEFLLPDVPSPLIDDPRSSYSLREMPAFNQEFYTTDENILLPVKQCYMYRIPKRENPRLYMTMSECSAIVAYTNSDVIVAHVSFSRIDQTDAVMQYIRETGVDPQHIHIVANVTSGKNDFRTWTNVPSFSEANRLKSVDEYMERYADMGILEENFMPFTYTYISEGNVSIRPITEVVVDKNTVYSGQSHFNHHTDKFVADSDPYTIQYAEA